MIRMKSCPHESREKKRFKISLNRDLLNKISKQKEDEDLKSEDEDLFKIYSEINKSTKTDIFKNQDYKAFFDNSVWDDYEDLVYAIERDKYEQAIKIADEDAISPLEVIRPTGDTIMHVCAEFGRLKILKFFYNGGGDMWSKNYADELPIHIAAREGQNETIEYILDTSNVPVDVQSIDGWTPFHYAVSNGYEWTVELLLKRGSCINTVDKFKRSALHWAVRYGFKEIVEILLKNDINYELIDIEGCTAFEIAKSMNNLEIMNMINEHYKLKKSK